ncbi:protein FRG1-like [Pollicipes pollicipes]|uniref:protein FRG1-like n=1 Tax=Pollicipes pollicipes TaxID=41117 RepID=UPI001885154F|nr:protein FRG1-like [Pollicipes pollicipes]XP_037070974.1 protein FRG1-like [Pollicipes pollicipes]
MSEYSKVKVGKLKLKGEKEKKHKKKSSKRKHEDHELDAAVAKTDSAMHGDWWTTSKVSEIRGSIAIELGDRTYIKALDNGLFTVGAPHAEGEGPDPEEVLMAVPVGDTRVAFKSGYGKYVGVDAKDRMVGRADAIGPMEQWEPVFQDGKTALQGGNSRFVSADNEDSVLVRARTAGQPEMVNIRSHSERAQASGTTAQEDEGNLNKVEINYVKQFQKFQDKRLRLHEGGAEELRVARDQGRLHESLLDRRAKMKADRYCK